MSALCFANRFTYCCSLSFQRALPRTLAVMPFLAYASQTLAQSRMSLSMMSTRPWSRSWTVFSSFPTHPGSFTSFNLRKDYQQRASKYEDIKAHSTSAVIMSLISTRTSVIFLSFSLLFRLSSIATRNAPTATNMSGRLCQYRNPRTLHKLTCDERVGRRGLLKDVYKLR